LVVHEPPQSTSVSSWFFTPSLQDAAAGLTVSVAVLDVTEFAVLLTVTV
jgi:hypothetical protein